MSRDVAWKVQPEVERFEEKFLLSVALPLSHLDPPGPVPLQIHQFSQGGALTSRSVQLIPVSTPLPHPVARVQVDNSTLVSGATYSNLSALEVINDTRTAIPRGAFTVGVAVASFRRSFPEAAWHPGQVIAFFAPISVQNIAFHRAGASAAIPANIYFNVRYHPATFTTTLHDLINSTFGGGRFKLV
jgi:hypothetical protein